MAEFDEIELRTEEVQEILTDIPHWIARWGSTIIFGVFLLLIWGSWLIKYPDIIVSQATIVTENPPVHVVTRSSGKIELFVANKAWVKRDTYLAVIENPATTTDVEKLREALNHVQGDVLLYYQELIDLGALNLGELQTDFSVLIQAAENYRYFVNDDYYDEAIRGINNQHNYYKVLNEKLVTQKNILVQELKIAENKYNNDQQLFKSGVISKQDLAQSEANFLQKKYAFQNAEINTVNNGIQLQENNKTVIDFEQRFDEKRSQLSAGLQEAFKQMVSALASWEQQYVLKAPIEGEVSFFKFYTNYQYVNAGEEMLTIIPKTGRIMALVYAPVYGAGKIVPGQQVNLKLESYPFKEYGIVNGTVGNISKTSRNNTYLVQVNLPQGLKTSYHRQLEFKQEMSASAEIVTENLRIIERVFNQFRSLIKNHS